MEEIGIDMSKRRGKIIEEFSGLDFDYVISLCGADAKEVVPVCAGEATQKLNWNFADPAEAEGREEEIMYFFRKVRDGIRARIDEFGKELEKEKES